MSFFLFPIFEGGRGKLKLRQCPSIWLFFGRHPLGKSSKHSEILNKDHRDPIDYIDQRYEISETESSEIS